MPVNPAFGLNDFGKPKSYSETESLANDILSVLLAKPGSFPSIPSLGMYVQGIVIRALDDIDESAIKNELVSQCSYFDDVVREGKFDVKKTETRNKDGEIVPLIVFMIPTVVKEVSRTLLIGISRDSSGLVHKFQWK